MGLLIEGQWHDQWYDTKSTGGKFERTEAQFRHWVTADGSPGPSGEGGFKAEPGRYHLYVSLACPWAHRTLIFRRLKGLEDAISVSVVNPFMGENGWSFEPGPGVIPDPHYNARFLHQIYTRDTPGYTGRVTVPILWDKQQQRIVNNESADIIRMLGRAFDDVGARAGDYYPYELHEEIDALNERIYNTVNNGVYKSGFATEQKVYEKAVTALFNTLTMLEGRLATQRYLAGDKLTEADWRLFTTLVRFDPVYHGHFKCNLRKLSEFPNLWAYTRDLYQVEGVAETVNMDHIKHHYYQSHTMINPTGIVPVGPEQDLSAPHDREQLS